MLSALKKLTNKNEVNGGGTQNGVGARPSEGVHSMSHKLQKKFAKGCNYNMKIVIRGDKNTGKSCLLNRLQGGNFKEEYCPTEEINVESINWSYKNTEDIVKVEVWDVVDVAKRRKKLAGLKVDNGTDEPEEFEPGLDAQFLDVYKQSHGAILIFDITKLWTFDYVKSEVCKVPSSIPILILANFVDQAHHRQVTKLEIGDFVENIVRQGSQPAEVRWAECSLRNGFGLKFLHNFFNIPFLTLQRESLVRQLEQNLREIQATHDELDLYMTSDAADYSKFSDQLANRRRQAADHMAPAPTRSIIVGTSSNSSSTSKDHLPIIQDTSIISYSNRAAVANETEHKASEDEQCSSKRKPAVPIPQSSNTSQSKETPSPSISKSGSNTNNNLAASKVDVENFVPDSGDFDNFLDDENTNSASSNQNAKGNFLDSSDDEDGGNPMVSKFDEDVDFDDYESVTEDSGTAQLQQNYESL